MEEHQGDNKTIDHDARLVNSDIPAALHNMLGILVSCYIVITDKVHQVQLPK
jgi:hypothetical protein